MYDVETLIVGAGVVGLAIAAKLARIGQQVVVLEKTNQIGSGISSRNSEVIHAGIYYPTGSKKHRFCVEGRRKLYQFADQRKVDFRKTGKLIVATSDSEVSKLQSILEQATNNEVENICLLSGKDAISLEPELSCFAAIHSLETGIIDSHALMLSLYGELEDYGGSIAFETPLEDIDANTDDSFSATCGGREPIRIRCRNLVNAAGLQAHAIARLLETPETEKTGPLFLAKGSYFSCQSRPRFQSLIYPAPVDGGLGVHLTLDLQGRMRFGPDVEWLEVQNPELIDYEVDSGRSESFYDAIRRYWPGLPEGSLTPDYAGCRPKLAPAGSPPSDFRIDGPNEHGFAGLVNLLGIESPGLTSSLAIADHVANML